jgi:hypothetical protein
MGRRIPTFQSFEDFRNFLLNETIAVGKEELSLGHWWLRHPERRQYDGITFQPNQGEVVGNKLNLWHGWAVEPQEGNWDLMKRHIREVLCASDPVGYEYLINWLAWMFQHPDEQAEVAVVFKGIRGSGKGTLGNAICKIFGQHAFHVSAASQFAGRFNAHLRDCCFLFADESYWAGDKSAEGTLQRLITEPDLSIEGKGRDMVMVRNMLHILQASNNDWVIPAGARERRFVVFETSDTHAQENEWFDPLYAQLENGGYGAMLWELLHRDISGFHPRMIVRNKALAAQQRHSLPYVEGAWSEILETGMLGGVHDIKIPNEVVSNDYEDVVGRKHKGLYSIMREMSPSLKHKSDRFLADYLTERGGNDEMGLPLVRRKKVGGHRGWAFPSLSQCRARWTEEHPEWEFNTDITGWGGEWNGAGEMDGGGAAANDNPTFLAGVRLLRVGDYK